MYCTCWLRRKNSWGPPLFTFLLGNNDVEGVHFRIKVLIGWLWLIAVKQKRKEQYLFHVSMNWTQLRSVAFFLESWLKMSRALTSMSKLICHFTWVSHHSSKPHFLSTYIFLFPVWSWIVFEAARTEVFSEWILGSQWFLRQPLEDSQKQRAPEWRPHCLEACEWLSECQQPAKQLRP